MNGVRNMLFRTLDDVGSDLAQSDNGLARKAKSSGLMVALNATSRVLASRLERFATSVVLDGTLGN